MNDFVIGKFPLQFLRVVNRTHMFIDLENSTIRFVSKHCVLFNTVIARITKIVVSVLKIFDPPNIRRVLEHVPHAACVHCNNYNT